MVLFYRIHDILKPHRGSKETMFLKEKADIVLKQGELFVEYPKDYKFDKDNQFAIKIGDGEKEDIKIFLMLLILLLLKSESKT